MKDTQAVLCVDSESIKNPRLVGLEGENLESQQWLRVFYDAEKTRDYLRQSPENHEVWVASSDGVDPINLAAALKKDSKMNKICLLAFQESGSLKSRASAAGIDKTFSQQEFLERYAQCKQNLCAQEGFRGTLSHGRKRGSTPPKTSEHKESPKLARVTTENKAISGKTAHVFTIVSASGGSGKSTLASITALYTQSCGHSTLLLDADMQFGDMHYIFGEENPLTIDKLLADRQLVSQLKPKDIRPALLAAPSRLEQAEQLSSEIAPMLDFLKPHFDVIVVNTGAFWTEQHISLLEKSTTGLFLIDQHASSIRACKHALDLCERCGIATRPFLFALNRCTRNASFTSIDVSCALRGSHVVELQEGGCELSDLLNAGLFAELLAARNDFCQSVKSMVDDIVPRTESNIPLFQTKSAPRRSFFRRKRRRVACL